MTEARHECVQTTQSRGRSSVGNASAPFLRGREPRGQRRAGQDRRGPQGSLRGRQCPDSEGGTLGTRLTSTADPFTRYLCLSRVGSKSAARTADRSPHGRERLCDPHVQRRRGQRLGAAGRCAQAFLPRALRLSRAPDLGVGTPGVPHTLTPAPVECGVRLKAAVGSPHTSGDPGLALREGW